jgi:hypothetical protein
MREVPRAAEPVREVVTSPDEETPEDHDISEVQEPPQMTFSHKRKPAWARDLIQDGEKYGVPEGTTRQVKRPKPFSSYTALMCNLLDEEPTCFEEAIQRKGMGRCHDRGIPIHNEEQSMGNSSQIEE